MRALIRYVGDEQELIRRYPGIRFWILLLQFAIAEGDDEAVRRLAGDRQVLYEEASFPIYPQPLWSSEDICGAILMLSEEYGGYGLTGQGVAVGIVDEGDHGRQVGAVVRQIAPGARILQWNASLGGDVFANSTEVILGVDTLVRQAISENVPLVINLSLGTSMGAHDGQSMFETYLKEVGVLGRNLIVVSAGNEGDAGHHASMDITTGEQFRQFRVGPEVSDLELQIWYSSLDRLFWTLLDPRGNPAEQGAVQLGPTPYQSRTGFRVRFPGAVTPGIWSVRAVPKSVREGRVDLWLPSQDAIGKETRFLIPDPEGTVTLPGTIPEVLTVGAYDSQRRQVAPFSGRGQEDWCAVKPDLIAPGVDLTTDLVGEALTGTSFSAPVVSAAAALCMEWGIVRENDAYLYGQKLKMFLLRGSRPLAGSVSPNVQEGWGRLCLESSLPD